MHVFENSDNKARQIWEIIENHNIPHADQERLCKLLSDFRTETIKEVELKLKASFDSLRTQSFDYWRVPIKIK
jgi:hypothetical protein